jgi:hypothetical protein
MGVCFRVRRVNERIAVVIGVGAEIGLVALGCPFNIASPASGSPGG